MKFSLKPDEYYMLRHGSVLRGARLERVSSVSCESHNYILEVSEDEALELREAVARRLQEVGFDRDYRLSEEGEVLERLIDKFFIR